MRAALAERALTPPAGATPITIVPPEHYPRLRGAAALVAAPAFAGRWWREAAARGRARRAPIAAPRGREPWTRRPPRRRRRSRPRPSKADVDAFFDREVASHFLQIPVDGPLPDRVHGALTTGEFSWGTFVRALAAYADTRGTPHGRRPRRRAADRPRRRDRIGATAARPSRSSTRRWRCGTSVPTWRRTRSGSRCRRPSARHGSRCSIPRASTIRRSGASSTCPRTTSASPPASRR